MHILQIYKDYFPILGGIENHIRDLSEGLATRGHHVTVLVTSLTRQTEITWPVPGLTLIKAARLAHFASTPLSIQMLLWARRIRADIVHLHFPYPPGDLAAMVATGNAPLVLTYHSDIVRQQTLLRGYRPLLTRTLQRAARIIPTSPHYIASSPFLHPLAEKCVVIPLGIHVERFADVDPHAVAAWRARYNPPIVLFVGRLRYYKGLHVLLDAFPQVQAKLLIAGSGPERDRLSMQAADLGIADRVHFLGDIDDQDLPALYRAADIFVLPAHLRAEALGLSQIEAMASGVPCVCTELGTGTSYANLHEQTGLVVAPSDPAALGEAVNRLLGDAALRHRYGEAGRQRASALFSHQRMLDQIEQLYRDLL